jgi:predicted ATPase/DNA-binding SARP family transcriptional activator
VALGPACTIGLRWIVVACMGASGEHAWVSGAPRSVRITLLGGFAVSVEGTVAAPVWRLRKAKTTVKLLALAAGHRLHRDVLIEQLWPEADAAVGANNFHQALHAARRVVGAENLVLHVEIVVLGGGGSVAVDVDEFDAAAVRAAATGALEDFRRALALWSGELLPEDLYEDWAAPHRDRLNGVRARLVGDLARVLTADGVPDEALALLEPLAVERPFDEDVHRSLLAALAASGRRWDAAAAFERLRDGLAESYGVAPTPETAAVYRRLFVGGAPDPGTCPHNLPTLSTSFVGRHRELAELRRLLERTRLLTLTGPGGAGKTRLAVEIAHGQVASVRWADGVWLVELAGVTSGDGVPSAVGGALELPLEGNRPWIPALVDQLSSRAILLILDNCEHVLDAVVPLATELLARCPDLVVLATSREPLGLPGEIAWRVPSLELPGGDEAPDRLARLESVQLFVERARHASPSFVLDAATAPPVAEICRRLDGIPLALELAAVRVVHLSVAQLSARLGDALAVLSRRGPGHPDRQQTLAATLDWSHDLLLDDERVAFRRLAVFAGGFDLDAAASVSAISDVIDVLSRLVDKSLVTADTTGEVARFRMLEVVRQYAEARLRDAGELPACVDRHRAWYAREAARHDPDRGVPVVLEPPPWFDAEMDNLRVAFASAIDEQPCLALELAVSAWRFLLSRGQLAEALGWLTAALDRCPQVSPLRMRALFAKGVLHLRRADIEPVVGVAHAITEASQGLGDDAMAIALDQESIFMLMAHDWPSAQRRSVTALAQTGSQPAIAVGIHHFAAVLAMALGEVGEARALLREAGAALDRVPDASSPFFTTLTVSWVVDDRGPVPLPVAEDTMLLGRLVGAAQARGHLAVAAALTERIDGRTDVALALLDDAIARFSAVGDAYGTGYALGQRGHTLRWAGDLAGALACFDAAEQVHRSLRDLRSIAMALAGRSYVAALQGEQTIARRRVQEAVLMMERSGDIAGVAHTLNIQGLIELELGVVDAALPPLVRSLSLADRGVTPAYAIGWEYLLVAHLHRAMGDGEASAAAAAEAAVRFGVFGDRRGERALQRARKAGAVTMPS